MSLQLKDYMGLVQHVVRDWRLCAQAAVESLQWQAGRAELCCRGLDLQHSFPQHSVCKVFEVFMCLHHLSMIRFVRQHGHGWGQHHRTGFAQYIRY